MTASQSNVDIVSRLREAGIETLGPDDDGYQPASLAFNRRYEGMKPIAIAYPDSTAQVAAAVKCAASLGIKVAARGGGHSYVAQSLNTGALTIDVSRINAVTVRQDGVATIDGGAKIGDVAITLYEQGKRAMGHGKMPYVGISGHAISGGFGLASRSLGLSLDAVISHEVVLANGTIIDTADDDDLRWALRGGGGSFGIVTSFRVQAVPAPSVNVVGVHLFNVDAVGAASMLKTLQQWSLSDAPSIITLEIQLLPGSSAGRLQVRLRYQCLSDQTTCDAIIKPLLAQLPAEASDPVVKEVDWLSALTIVADPFTLPSSDAADVHDNFVEASIMTPSSQPISDEAFAKLTQYLVHSDGTWFVQFELWGGNGSAISAVPVHETAVFARDTLFAIEILKKPDPGQSWPSSGIDFVTQVRASIVDSMPSSWTWATCASGVYREVVTRSDANYVDTILPTSEYLERTYGGHLQRLVTIKNTVDPSNLIQFPTSIPPSL